MRVPVVTGISPKEGPPGTRVTIRGEHLGIGLHDLIGLTICGVDCLLSAEWKAPNKIIARFGAGSGSGDVIVTTRSGGKGTCTVQFKGKVEKIGPFKESAVWIDESCLMNLSFGRKRPTSPSQLHHDNPLGLSDEGNVKKFPEDVLHELFPEGSGNLTSENFIPAWFLLENHNEVSFDDVKAGLTCLRRNVNNQKKGELSFLKANVGSVMDQLDTVNILTKKMNADKGTGPNAVDHLEQAVQSTKEEADALFQDVLGRKEHADATRSALGVLQKFKFLFNLPCTIERNIQKGDFDIVINDYAKAKSLCATTHVPMFKKVYEEVDQRICGFRDMLYARLRDLPLSLDEQKNMIRYLVNLESPGDPAWDCIEYQCKFISQVMNTCKDHHLRRDKLDSEDVGIAFVEKTKFTCTYGKDLDKNALSLDQWQSCQSAQILFLKELTEIVQTMLPDLCRLGQAYAKGDLTMRDDDPTRHSKIDPACKTAFEKMLLTTVGLYSNLIRAAVVPHTLNTAERSQCGLWTACTKEILGAWLPQSIRHIRSCYASLIRLHLPVDALDVIQQLIFDLRIRCLHVIFVQATADVEGLHVRETWAIEVDDDHGGTTQLPILYENVVVETLQLIKESVLQTELRETQLLSNAQVSAKITSQVQRLLQAFATTLETLAFRKDSPGEESSVEQNMKLIIILSNCGYTVQHVVPRFEDQLRKNGYLHSSAIATETTSSLKKLHDKLFEAYIELKSSPMVDAIKETVGQCHWSEDMRPNGVSTFVKEILLHLVSVHAEVFSVSRDLVQSTMERLVQSAIQQVSRMFCCVSKFSEAGSMRGRVDLLALQAATTMYKTNNSHVAFREAIRCLRPVATPGDQKIIEENVKRFQHEMKFYLMCFRSISSSQG